MFVSSNVNSKFMGGHKNTLSIEQEENLGSHCLEVLGLKSSLRIILFTYQNWFDKGFQRIGKYMFYPITDDEYLSATL